VLIADLRATLPAFVELLVNHRPEALRGQSLSEVMGLAERQPARLAAYYASWRAAPAAMYTAPPSLVFAVIGQARLDGRISPEEESRLLAELLTHWALRSTLATSATCATPPRQDR
jgi:hypothetical protein